MLKNVCMRSYDVKLKEGVDLVIKKVKRKNIKDGNSGFEEVYETVKGDGSVATIDLDNLYKDGEEVVDIAIHYANDSLPFNNEEYLNGFLNSVSEDTDVNNIVYLKVVDIDLDSYTVTVEDVKTNVKSTYDLIRGVDEVENKTILLSTKFGNSYVRLKDLKKIIE